MSKSPPQRDGRQPSQPDLAKDLDHDGDVDLADDRANDLDRDGRIDADDSSIRDIDKDRDIDTTDHELAEEPAKAQTVRESLGWGEGAAKRPDTHAQTVSLPKQGMK